MSPFNYGYVSCPSEILRCVYCVCHLMNPFRKYQAKWPWIKLITVDHLAFMRSQRCISSISTYMLSFKLKCMIFFEARTDSCFLRSHDQKPRRRLARTEPLVGSKDCEAVYASHFFYQTAACGGGWRIYFITVHQCYLNHVFHIESYWVEFHFKNSFSFHKGGDISFSCFPLWTVSAVDIICLSKWCITPNKFTGNDEVS